MSRRTQMLASTIHRELMRIIQRDLSDPRIIGMPSITRVKVSDDLAYADVFVTIMGTPGQRSAALNALKHSAGLMRTKLTKALTLRVAPFVRFQLDHDLAKEMVVLDLLRKAAEESADFERRRAEAAGEPVPTDSATPPPVVSSGEPHSGGITDESVAMTEPSSNPEEPRQPHEKRKQALRRTQIPAQAPP